MALRINCDSLRYFSTGLNSADPQAIRDLSYPVYLMSSCTVLKLSLSLWFLSHSPSSLLQGQWVVTLHCAWLVSVLYFLLVPSSLMICPRAKAVGKPLVPLQSCGAGRGRPLSASQLFPTCCEAFSGIVLAINGTSVFCKRILHPRPLMVLLSPYLFASRSPASAEWWCQQIAGGSGP